MLGQSKGTSYLADPSGDLVFKSLSLGILNDVEGTFPAGVTGLLGLNGAGKTTLIRALSSAVRPKRGQVCWRGQNIYGSRNITAAFREGLGWMPQAPSYPPGMTVSDFVAYAGWLKKVGRPRLERRVRFVLEAVELSPLRGQRMATLSGGELRRAMMASALVNEPQLLILDEPTANLDPDQRERMLQILRLPSEGESPPPVVILATHLLEDVQLSADHVMVIDKGAVVPAQPVTTFVGVDERMHVTVEGIRAAFKQTLTERADTA